MIVLPNQDAWDRISKSVREAESHRGGSGPEGQQPRGGYPGIFVEVTGPPVAVTTTTTTSSTSGTTTTTGTTTSSTGTGTTTTCNIPTSSTSATTSTSIGQKFVYPGKFVYRNRDSLTNKEWWVDGEVTWIQEISNKGLGFGCRYPGNIAGEYLGRLIVGVRGDGTNVSCSSSSTSTSQGCGGYCQWSLESTGWELVENFCCGSPTCNCPQPDFCPADGGCANTVTYCAPGADPSHEIVDCRTTTTTTSGTGTTTTTSSTGTTSTTTHNPSDCGTGCLWIGDPLSGVPILVTSDCHAGTVLSGGCLCAGCIPPTSLAPCVPFTTPCTIDCPPPPPPPSCTGGCTWLCTVFDSWLLYEFRCASSGGVNCICSPPSVGCSCGTWGATICFTPSTPTTSGTGTTGTGTTTTSSTSATTSTTRGGCLDTCQMRWDVDADPPKWVAIRDCGSACGCAAPLFDGTDPCDIVHVPCINTTTTTTSSTTTTTTTTGCGADCTWTCSQDSFRYYWNLTTPCPTGCDCPPPVDVCSPTSPTGPVGVVYAGLGDKRIIPCGPIASTTTTSSTSTTTTTTVPAGCDDALCNGMIFNRCCFCCALTGTFPPTYAWVICGQTCLGGSHCDYSIITGLPCDSVHGGQTVCANCVGGDTSTTHSATGTTGTETAPTPSTFSTALPPPTSTSSTTTTT